jgi:hypothetical protein
MRRPREQATRLPLLVLLCVRLPMAGALAVTAAGLLLLTGVDAQGSYLADVLPGMLITGAGLGVAVVCVAVSVLSGAADKESGMLSGLNTTGHEIGGSLGVAVLTTIAAGSAGAAGGPELASGIGDAFLVASALAAIASLLALAILPSAESFLPKLRLAPPVSVH